MKLPMISTKKATSAPFYQWDLATVIDLEYLNGEDEDHEGMELKKRDRNFYLQLGKEVWPDASFLSSRSVVLRRWVDQRRKSADFPDPGPGEATAEILNSLRLWGFLGFILFGALFAWGALNITGQQVNVLLFWVITVGIPLILSLVGFFLLLGGHWPRPARNSGILLKVLSKLIFNAGLKAVRNFDKRLSQQGRNKLGRLHGTNRKRLYGHGPVISGTLTSLVHLLGLGIVTGIFISICLFRTVSYQNYGWQTHSGWLTDKKLHSIVSAVATPWRWYAADGVGYPTVTQIHETRFFHNDSNGQENPVDSTTWSSFLMWSSLYYGLLPRLALLLLGKRSLRRAFAREDFHKYDALWRRLTTGVVIINPPIESPPPETPLHPPAQRPNTPVNGPEILLVPHNLDATQLMQDLVEPLKNQSLQFSQNAELPSLPTERRSLLQSLVDPSVIRPARLLIVQQSFMPPNSSFLRFVSEECRNILGDTIPIHVVLLHDADGPNADNLIAGWRQRFDLLGDPLISLVILS